MILLSHPTGNQNSRALLRAFAGRGLLYEFHTSFAAFGNEPLLSTFFPQVQRRRFDPGLKTRIKTHPRFEFSQRLRSKLPAAKWWSGSGEVPTMYEAAQGIDREIAGRVAALKDDSLSGVYAYEDMALRTFESARSRGLQCWYDLPIGYWRAYRDLLDKERERAPEWAMTLTGFRGSAEKFRQKDRELELADHVFAASKFTLATLKYYPKKLRAEVHVIPYGFPAVDRFASNRSYDFHRAKRPLKLLFVGGLSQRKGLSYLFEAVAAFGNRVELTVVGRKPMEDCRALNEALDRCHRWIPSLPHHRVLELMRGHDLLVFPSLFEGFGLVITEAMSQGTPVLATERTAAPDIITDGADGRLVKAASTDDLIHAIESLLTQPESLERMGKAATRTAAKRPWSVYGEELVDKLRQIS